MAKECDRWHPYLIPTMLIKNNVINKTQISRESLTRGAIQRMPNKIK